MKNKKFIIVSAIALGLITTGSVKADNANNLLKMDVKRASTNDSVDVTFYTTEGSYNSVVTRKSDNRYVVLLPNTASASSIVPSLGGVKDLISDVNVKNVDDGIGGYTKVTFTTTKPVKIQTYTKKTAPLTKAQEEYKNLIAKHESTPATSIKKTQADTVTKSSAAAKTPAQAKTVKTNVTAKPTTVTNTTKPADTKKTISTAAKSSVVSKPVAQTTKNSVANSQEKTQVQPKSKVVVPTESNVVADTKPIEKTVSSADAVKDKQIEKTSTPETQTVLNNTTDKNISATTQNKSKLNKMPLYGALAVLGLFLLSGIFNIIASFAVKRSRKNTGSINETNYVSEQNNKLEYQRIMNDTSLNWQEKYKQYTQTDKKLNPQEDSEDLTYITDSKAEKRAILDSTSANNDKTRKPSNKASIPSLNSNGLSFKARVSQMEHALANTPKMQQSDTKPKTVQSEDKQIAKTMTEVKLKSFAKQNSLKETNRNMFSNFREQIKNNANKEGHFVKLKNSPLSVARRNSASSVSGVTNVIKYGNDTISDKVVDMVSKKENYSSTSLGEYLSKLDSENLVNMPTSTSSVVESKITNPIQNTISEKSQTSKNTMDGMKILSSYEVDTDKGFYLVDDSGSTAIISKNGDNISVIKRFNSKISKSLQVRLDYDSVYIVRVGDYKCLVDIDNNKTLLEI